MFILCNYKTVIVPKTFAFGNRNLR